MEITTLNFKSPIPPSVNKYLDKHIRKNGRRYAQLGFEKSKETLIYENHMRNVFYNLKKEKDWVTPDNTKFFEVNLKYYMHKKGTDPDNTLKLLLDNMVHNDIIPTDSQVLVKMHELFIDSKNPRIEVELKVLDKIGVFKDSTQLTEFKIKNCYKCKRYFYKKPCGCLKSFLQNYITEDLDLAYMACKKIKIISEGKECQSSQELKKETEC